MMSALPVNNEVAGMLLAKITPPGSRIFTSNVNQVILGGLILLKVLSNNNKYVKEQPPAAPMVALRGSRIGAGAPET